MQTYQQLIDDKEVGQLKALKSRDLKTGNDFPVYRLLETMVNACAREVGQRHLN
jgi:hypothetical protein